MDCSLYCIALVLDMPCCASLFVYSKEVPHINLFKQIKTPQIWGVFVLLIYFAQVCFMCVFCLVLRVFIPRLPLRRLDHKLYTYRPRSYRLCLTQPQSCRTLFRLLGNYILLGIDHSCHIFFVGSKSHISHSPQFMQ